MSRHRQWVRPMKLLCLVLTLIVSCRREVTVPELIDRIFQRHGFMFVWASGLQRGEVAETLKEAHPLKVGDPPSSIQPGRGYVFHARAPFSVEEVGTSKLPESIRQVGCTVIAAPAGESGFVHLFVGGPEFVVRFKCGASAYRIEGRVDPYLAASTRGQISVALVLVREK